MNNVDFGKGGGTPVQALAAGQTFGYASESTASLPPAYLFFQPEKLVGGKGCIF